MPREAQARQGVLWLPVVPPVLLWHTLTVTETGSSWGGTVTGTVTAGARPRSTRPRPTQSGPWRTHAADELGGWRSSCSRSLLDKGRRPPCRSASAAVWCAWSRLAHSWRRRAGLAAPCSNEVSPASATRPRAPGGCLIAHPLGAEMRPKLDVRIVAYPKRGARHQARPGLLLPSHCE